MMRVRWRQVQILGLLLVLWGFPLIAWVIRRKQWVTRLWHGLHIGAALLLFGQWGWNHGGPLVAFLVGVGYLVARQVTIWGITWGIGRIMDRRLAWKQRKKESSGDGTAPGRGTARGAGSGDDGDPEPG